MNLNAHTHVHTYYTHTFTQNTFTQIVPLSIHVRVCRTRPSFTTFLCCAAQPLAPHPKHNTKENISTFKIHSKFRKIYTHIPTYIAYTFIQFSTLRPLLARYVQLLGVCSPRTCASSRRIVGRWQQS